MSMTATRAAWAHIRTFKLSVPARLVLLALADRHNQETGRCDPSLATISGDTQLSERAVRLGLRELEREKLISTTERKLRTGRGKRNLTNRYRIKGGAQYAAGMGNNMPPNHTIPPSAFDDLAMMIENMGSDNA